MKTLLSIGYSRFILPANTNVNAVIAALQKATPVREDYRDGKCLYYPEAREGRMVNISIQLVPDDSVINTKALKRLPEQAGPDAHNTF